MLSKNVELTKLVGKIDSQIQQTLEKRHQAAVAALAAEVDALADACTPIHGCWKDTGEHRAVVEAHLPLFTGLRAKAAELQQAERLLKAVCRQADPVRAQSRADAATVLLEDLVFPQVNKAVRQGLKQARIDLSDYRPRIQVTLAKTMRLRLRSSRLDGQSLVIDLP